ncbi:hypothetical protein BTO20_06075 [Mycobacterium dioxanotrophicus]|uniref:Uncharacterized protein n=1 Tax=Mycobacterium dioxanotrophicus TaxID=482462 RepID=A0A1Y0BZA8_9MYCO|nr:hypothetical protein BTO20_06075 [Mycobacterium dioxanotrophicus]
MLVADVLDSFGHSLVRCGLLGGTLLGFPRQVLLRAFDRFEPALDVRQDRRQRALDLAQRLSRYR